jgi:hypothetical protein
MEECVLSIFHAVPCAFTVPVASMIANEATANFIFFMSLVFVGKGTFAKPADTMKQDKK